VKKAKAGKKRFNRPASITIATMLQIAQGGGLLVYGIYQLLRHGWALSETVGGWRYIPFPLFESVSSGLILTALGLFTLLVAIAFYFLKEWAWLAAMTMQGLGLFVGLVNYARHRPNFLGMALAVVLVMYLNHQEVQQAFRRSKHADP